MTDPLEDVDPEAETEAIERHSDTFSGCGLGLAVLAGFWLAAGALILFGFVTCS